MQVEESIEKERSRVESTTTEEKKSKKKYYIFTAIVFIAVLYPVYLAFVDVNGLGGVIKSLITTP